MVSALFAAEVLLLESESSNATWHKAHSEAYTQDNAAGIRKPIYKIKLLALEGLYTR
jgi:hypothetical protein